MTPRQNKYDETNVLTLYYETIRRDIFVKNSILDLQFQIIVHDISYIVISLMIEKFSTVKNLKPKI